MNLPGLNIHNFFFAAFWVIAVLVISRVHDRLRTKTPRARLAVGSIGIGLAFLAFLAIMLFLPKPATAGYSVANDVALLASCSLFSVLLIGSSMQVLGGSVRGFKRWRYYRREVR